MSILEGSVGYVAVVGGYLHAGNRLVSAFTKVELGIHADNNGLYVGPQASGSVEFAGHLVIEADYKAGVRLIDPRSIQKSTPVWDCYVRDYDGDPKAVFEDAMGRVFDPAIDFLNGYSLYYGHDPRFQGSNAIPGAEKTKVGPIGDWGVGGPKGHSDYHGPKSDGFGGGPRSSDGAKPGGGFGGGKPGGGSYVGGDDKPSGGGSSKPNGGGDDKPSVGGSSKPNGGSHNSDDDKPSSGGNSSGSKDDKNKGNKPILLDLDGDGIEIIELSQSTVFMDAGGDGLLHRTAWAGAGDGVLFFDPDGRNAITEKRQYVFTEWGPTATSDLEAIRAVFDSNGDGKLTPADADFAKFKVLVTNADGSTTAMTLMALGFWASHGRGLMVKSHISDQARSSHL